ncbi:MAG: hypothetical protein H5U11_13800, partial [Rhizobium sp.]|nr:hypothetical protein [Rhizobium sp.]
MAISKLRATSEQVSSRHAEICRRFGPRNHELLAKRDTLQKQIDAWHIARQGQ